MDLRGEINRLIIMGKDLAHNENARRVKLASQRVFEMGPIDSNTPGFDKWLGNVKIYHKRYLSDHPLCEDLRSALFHKKYPVIMGLLESICDDMGVFPVNPDRVSTFDQYQTLPTGLTKHAHDLLIAIVKSANPVELLGRWFKDLSWLDGEALRASLRELKERGYIDRISWADNVPHQVILSNAAKAYVADHDTAKIERFSTMKSDKTDMKRVFIAHGHDNGIKEEVARFIEQQGLQAVILHEQPDQGQTIIEKIMANSDVGYAVVLYSPDDQGRSKTETEYKSRARQNVIFEHGIFVGKLGRDHVCALFNGELEPPSDLNGVMYISMSKDWRSSLIREMKSLGYDVSMDKVL